MGDTEAAYPPHPHSPPHPSPQVLVYVVGGHWRALFIYVPQLESHVVTAEDVSAILAESDVRDAGNDLREEGLVGLKEVRGCKSVGGTWEGGQVWKRGEMATSHQYSKP